MFDGVKSPFPLLPILDPHMVVDKVLKWVALALLPDTCRAIKTEQKELFLPGFVGACFPLRLLPVGVRDYLGRPTPHTPLTLVQLLLLDCRVPWTHLQGRGSWCDNSSVRNTKRVLLGVEYCTLLHLLHLLRPSSSIPTKWCRSILPSRGLATAIISSASAGVKHSPGDD